MKTIAALMLLASTIPVLAQQPTPSQTAIQIDNVINQWAQTIEVQESRLKAAQERIDALKAKCGKLCEEPEKK